MITSINDIPSIRIPLMIGRRGEEFFDYRYTIASGYDGVMVIHMAQFQAEGHAIVWITDMWAKEGEIIASCDDRKAHLFADKCYSLFVQYGKTIQQIGRIFRGEESFLLTFGGK